MNVLEKLEGVRNSQLCLIICHALETMLLIFISPVWVFSKTHLNSYHPLANLKQWDSYENLYLCLLGVTYSQERQAPIQLGPAWPLPWRLTRKAIHAQSRFSKGPHNCFTREKSILQKDTAPCLGSSRCSVTFLRIPRCRWRNQGTLFQPALSFNWVPGFGDVTELQVHVQFRELSWRLEEILGVGPSAWSNSSVIWSSRS